MPKVNKKKFRYSSTFYRRIKQNESLRADASTSETKTTSFYNPTDEHHKSGSDWDIFEAVSVDECSVSSSETESQRRTNLRTNNNIKQELKEWALKYSIPHVALNNIETLIIENAQ